MRPNAACARSDAEVTVASSGDRSGAAVQVEEIELGEDGGEPGTSRVAVVLTLSKPDRLNAIDWEMLGELDAAIEELSHQVDLCCVLLTVESNTKTAFDGSDALAS